MEPNSHPPSLPPIEVQDLDGDVVRPHPAPMYDLTFRLEEHTRWGLAASAAQLALVASVLFAVSVAGGVFQAVRRGTAYSFGYAGFIAGHLEVDGLREWCWKVAQRIGG